MVPASHYDQSVSVTRSSPSRVTAVASGPEADQDEVSEGSPAPPVAVELKILVALVVGAGLVLRFVTRSPLWLDEALSVNIASLPIGEIPEALRHDGHPPLYYVLLHLSMAVAGKGDNAVRALSGLFSVASMPLAYLVGRRRGGPLLGWIFLGLFALSPFVVRYATETRMYSLLMLLVLMGYLLVDDLVRGGKPGWGRVAGLAIVVSAFLYSHYWTMWLLGAVGLVLLFVWRRAARDEQRKGSARALVALVAGGITFLAWVPSLLYQSAHTGTPWAGPVRPTSLLASTLTDFGGGAFKDAQFVGALLLVLVLLAVFGHTIDSRRIEIDLRSVSQFRVEAIVVGLTIVVGLLVSYATASAFVTRYTSVFVPLVLLLAAGGLTRLADRWIRFGAVAVTMGLFGLGCTYNLSTPRTQAGIIATEIATRAKPEDVVVYCPDQLGPATVRLLPAGLRQFAYPTTSSPERIDWVDYGVRNQADPSVYANQVADLAGTDHNLFVVWSGGYKTHQGSCEAFLGELTHRRGAPETLVSEDGDKFFEHGNLDYFPAA